MIQIIKTKEELSTIRERWNQLFESASNISPFQSFAYINVAIDYLKEILYHLHIVCVVRQKDKKLLAIFPCYIDEKKALRFINDVDADFCSPIVHKDFVSDYHIYEEFADHVKKEKSIRHIRFENLTAHNQTLGFLHYFFDGSIVFNNNAYSVVKITKLANQPKGFVDCINFLNSKEKYRLTNVIKKMEGEELVVYSNQQGEDYPQAIMNKLIDGMVNKGIRDSRYFNHDFLLFIHKLYDEGLLIVAVTEKGSIPLAANICYPMGNDLIDWLAIYSEPQYNLHNLLQIVEMVSKSGGYLNFARGTYEYKIHNFRPVIYNLYSLRYSATTLGLLDDIRHVGWYFLRKLVKRIITNRKK